MSIFGFKIIPAKTWLVIPVYAAGYTIIDMLMHFSSLGLSFSLIFNVLGQQMLFSWKIGYVAAINNQLTV